MYLIIDFGLTRAANKIKKNIWEKDFFNIGLDTHRTRVLANKDKLGTGSVLGKNKIGNTVYKGSNRINRRDDIGLPKLTRKLRSGEYTPRTKVIKEMILDSKNYTDIRKTKDTALSTTGYMGFKNTPNSYFEEAVPTIETGKKTKVKYRVLV